MTFYNGYYALRRTDGTILHGVAYGNDVHDLYKLGIVSGVSDTEFAPYANITRQEAAVIIKNLSAFLGKDVTAPASSFADRAEIDLWAADAVAYTAHNGIMNGKTHGFAPKDNISIQESILICFRYFQNI